MKLIWILLCCSTWALAQHKPTKNKTPDKPQRPAFTAKELAAANTAAKLKYLTDAEKEVIMYVNLARMYPKKFGQIYKFGKDTLKMKKDYYLGGLLYAFDHVKPMGALKPDSLCWESAKCHAITSGLAGHYGHDRVDSTCFVYYSGENISYGCEKPMEIVLQLLIDRGEKSLGHCKNIWTPGYTHIGVSIQPHTRYRFNCVLEFWAEKYFTFRN